MRYFEPWRGDLYDKEGVFGIRLLIVGEAHYGKPEDLRPTFTQYIIRELAQKSRFRFYSVVRALVLGTSGWASDADRRAFWDRVAFCNFIQEFPSDGPRVAPKPDMWRAGGSALIRTVTELMPQLILVLGHRLNMRFPELPNGVNKIAVCHPSGGGYRHSDWQPKVREAIIAVGASVPDILPVTAADRDLNAGPAV